LSERISYSLPTFQILLIKASTQVHIFMYFPDQLNDAIKIILQFQIIFSYDSCKSYYVIKFPKGELSLVHLNDISATNRNKNIHYNYKHKDFIFLHVTYFSWFRVENKLV
jgi:hypothetical protein